MPGEERRKAGGHLPQMGAIPLFSVIIAWKEKICKLFAKLKLDPLDDLCYNK